MTKNSHRSIKRPREIPVAPSADAVVYTVPEAAFVLRVSMRTAREYLRRGVLPGFRVGSRWFVSRAALEAYIAGESGTPVAQAQ